MDETTLLSDIHAQFRRLRCGAVAESLQAQGIRYRLAWGVESYRLKEIAQRYRPDASLAERLWNEETRESRMLATRLYPLESLTEEKAEEWSRQIPYAEIADQACMNLFARAPFAPRLIERWLTGTPMQRYCALQLALRLDYRPTHVVEQAAQMAADALQPAWLRAAAVRFGAENQE